MTFNLRVCSAVFAAATGLVSGLGGAPEAQAATIQARFTYSHQTSTSISTGPTTRNVSTVKFHWSRVDTPGAGVDATLTPQFEAYCIEPNQSVSPNTNHVYEVLSPEAAGWSADKILGVQTLWAGHYSGSFDTATNAAFQIAMWELTYDGDRNLDTGSFRVASNTGEKSLAQNWLTGLSDLGPRGPLPTLTVLRSPTVQDQITVQIPAPGAAACAMVGLVMLGGRRRR